jgi:YD repeat-containing protein
MNNKMMMMLGFFVFIALFGFSGVNLKNGNFYVSYTDILFKDSRIKLQIWRTYNSKIVDAGWYGSGWGNQYETFLHTMPGGGAVIHWWGSGARSYYKPAEWDVEEITRAVDQIIELEKTAGNVKTPDEILNLRSDLMNDMEFRYAYWRKYLNKGSFQEYPIKQNTKLFTTKGTFSKLVVTDSGFINTGGSDSMKYYFNKSGKLSEIVDVKGNFIVLTYDVTNKIKSIRDNDDNTLYFTMDENGRVLKIEDQNQRVATFLYDGNRNLVYSKDAGGNQYWHGYDSRNKMTSITYVDSTKLILEYNKNGWVIKLKDRNGNVNNYDYQSRSDLDFGTLVTNRNARDSITGKNFYWYNLSKNEVGSTWTHKITTIENEKDTIIKVYNYRTLIDTLIHNDTIWVFHNTTRGSLLKVTNNKGFSITPEINSLGIMKVSFDSGWYFFNYKADGSPGSVSTSKGLTIPYPYPDDHPEFTKDISMIHDIIRILGEWMDYNSFIGRWK